MTKRKRGSAPADTSITLDRTVPFGPKSRAEKASEAIAAALGEPAHPIAEDLAAHASALSLQTVSGPGLKSRAKTSKARAPVMSPSKDEHSSDAHSAPRAARPLQEEEPVRRGPGKRPSRPRLSTAIAQGSATVEPSRVDSTDEPPDLPSSPTIIAAPRQPDGRWMPAQPRTDVSGDERISFPPPEPNPAITPALPEPPPRASDSATDAGPDLDVLTRNMARYFEVSGQVAAAYLTPREKGALHPDPGETVVGTLNSLGRIAESWVAHPARMFEAQAALSHQLFGLWTESLQRFGDPAQVPPSPRPSDKRFAAPEWQSSPIFYFLHKAYLTTTQWAKAMVADADDVDEATREKAAFYLRQISSALSPSNFLATNPELLKETFKENGENLVRGMQMLAEDIAAGHGEVKIRQSDTSRLKLGIDMASTPGKVVFRNDLMELIQYAPSTPQVLKRPVLIVPPWINKFYVLDLNADKSFIRWLVSQQVTVFVISWVNPDARHATKDWDSYMREGIFAALDAVESATGETEVSTVGYCVGGTLLAATLAFMAANDDARIASSTFLTTQVDFEHAGDLKVFADEAQIRVVEQQMKSTGYLPGSKMATAFNMLRPDELIWSYSVDAYLKGKSPTAFDLLSWNADSTRMSAANHAFYLRNCYLENNLTRGEMVIGGQRLNLGAVTIPIYDLATKEDHIAPARSVYVGARFFGGPVRYVLAGSGHIAGVVNPPARAKYQYWSDGDQTADFEHWMSSARETKGTWWLDWIAWFRDMAPETVPARQPGEGQLPALCDAPGTYVLVQS